MLMEQQTRERSHLKLCHHREFLGDQIRLALDFPYSQQQACGKRSLKSGRFITLWVCQIVQSFGSTFQENMFWFCGNYGSQAWHKSGPFKPFLDRTRLPNAIWGRVNNKLRHMSCMQHVAMYVGVVDLLALLKNCVLPEGTNHGVVARMLFSKARDNSATRLVSQVTRGFLLSPTYGEGESNEDTRATQVHGMHRMIIHC
jgi:hypothetical protein